MSGGRRAKMRFSARCIHSLRRSASITPSWNRRWRTRRTLAIELGEKRVGLAMSDEGGKLATPLEVLEVTSADKALGLNLPLIAREGVARIVLGLPLDMDGKMGPAARSVITWGKTLHEK